MICGIGTDIVEIPRIQRSLERFGMLFVKKVLSEEEIAHLAKDLDVLRHMPSSARTRPFKSLAARLAARFAAKEAGAKALGTGLHVGLHNIRIIKLPSGQPHITFWGAAAEKMHRIKATKAHLSLSHERNHAIAVVILEKLP